MSTVTENTPETVEDLRRILENDTKVKVAGQFLRLKDIDYIMN